jgi:hypothetical protein
MKTMKTVLFLLTTTLMLVSSNSCIQAQNNDKEIKAMLQEFYTAYITEVASNSPPKLMMRNIDSLQKRYCSVALLKKISDITELMEGDPFLKAQDSDIGYLNTLAVEKDSGKKNQYIVTYIDTYSPNKEKVSIYLTVLKDKDSYKIDAIW